MHLQHHAATRSENKNLSRFIWPTIAALSGEEGIEAVVFRLFHSGPVSCFPSLSFFYCLRLALSLSVSVSLSLSRSLFFSAFVCLSVFLFSFYTSVFISSLCFGCFTLAQSPALPLFLSLTVSLSQFFCLSVFASLSVSFFSSPCNFFFYSPCFGYFTLA